MSSELIDVLNENGVLTGEVLPRDEIHKKGYQVLTNFLFRF